MRSKLAKSFFVTGTDTGIGKTTVTKMLISEFKKKGFITIGCKPFACGFNEAGDNEDVLTYEMINSIKLERKIINPLSFALPASPNIAAKMENKYISAKSLADQVRNLHELRVDYIFYEGVGGWKVPLNSEETMIDFARYLSCPLILVIGIRVGCLNHALLTWESISKEKIKVAGWIANIVDPQTPQIAEHISTIKHWISAPYLGTLSYQEGLQQDHSLNINLILQSHSCHQNMNS